MPGIHENGWPRAAARAKPKWMYTSSSGAGQTPPVLASPGP
ncbi:hypothetical protein [Sorangium cellulosum]|nr:hypothetical protein [Sorangium cellulosum]